MIPPEGPPCPDGRHWPSSLPTRLGVGDLDVPQGGAQLPEAVPSLPSLAPDGEKVRLLPMAGAPALLAGSQHGQDEAHGRDEGAQRGAEEVQAPHCLGDRKQRVPEKEDVQILSFASGGHGRLDRKADLGTPHWRLVQDLQLGQQDADMSGGPASPAASIQTMDLVSMMGDLTPQSAPPTPPKATVSIPKPSKKPTNSSSIPPRAEKSYPEDNEAWQQFRAFTKKSQSASSSKGPSHRP